LLINSVHMQVLCFWTLSIVLFLFKTQRFGDWILSPSLGVTCLVGAQSIELVPVSGDWFMSPSLGVTCLVGAQSIELVPVSGDWILSPSSGGTYSVGPNR
jgi:hypothetical protein